MTTTPPSSPAVTSSELSAAMSDLSGEDTADALPQRNHLPVVKRLVGLVATHDDGDRLQQCLASLADVCDTIVVVDHASTDETLAIAEKYGAEVVVSPNVLPLVGSKAKSASGQIDTVMAWQAGLDTIIARQTGLENNQNDTNIDAVQHWVLWVNPYEQLTEQSVNELELWKKTKLANDSKTPVGLRCKITPVYGGKRLQHGQLIRHELRLACVDAVRIIDHPYFEGLECPEGNVGYLPGVNFLAEPYTSAQALIAGVAALSARANRHALEASGKWPKANLVSKLFAPAWAFAKQYWVRGSWLDGNAGLVMSKAQALAVFFRQEEALAD